METGFQRKAEHPKARGPDKVDIHVGNRLRTMRTLAGMSQTALGDKIGITFQQIQKYESGANRISASRLWNFAMAFGVQVSSFFEGLDGTPTETPIPLQRRTLETVRNLERCPPAIRKKLWSVIQAIADASSGLEGAPAQNERRPSHEGQGVL